MNWIPLGGGLVFAVVLIGWFHSIDPIVRWMNNRRIRKSR